MIDRYNKLQGSQLKFIRMNNSTCNKKNEWKVIPYFKTLEKIELTKL